MASELACKGVDDESESGHSDPRLQLMVVSSIARLLGELASSQTLKKTPRKKTPRCTISISAFNGSFDRSIVPSARQVPDLPHRGSAVGTRATAFGKNELP